MPWMEVILFEFSRSTRRDLWRLRSGMALMRLQLRSSRSRCRGGYFVSRTEVSWLLVALIEVRNLRPERCLRVLRQLKERSIRSRYLNYAIFWVVGEVRGGRGGVCGCRWSRGRRRRCRSWFCRGSTDVVWNRVVPPFFTLDVLWGDDDGVGVWLDCVVVGWELRGVALDDVVGGACESFLVEAVLEYGALGFVFDRHECNLYYKNQQMLWTWSCSQQKIYTGR